MPDLRLLLQNVGQRRMFALVEPREQIRLALIMLTITTLFLVLAIGNGYLAFAPMLKRAVSAAPEVWERDFVAQTGLYLVVTVAIAVIYAAAMIGASIAFVSQIAGPLIAIRRHVRALKAGRYTSRIHLRAGTKLYGEIADSLNELAESLERSGPPPKGVVREAA